MAESKRIMFLGERRFVHRMLRANERESRSKGYKPFMMTGSIPRPRELTRCDGVRVVYEGP